jgi:hypothetical protein
MRLVGLEIFFLPVANAALALYMRFVDLQMDHEWLDLCLRHTVLYRLTLESFFIVSPSPG